MKILMITSHTPIEDHICSVWTVKGGEVCELTTERAHGYGYISRNASEKERIATRIVARDYDFVFSIGYDHEVSCFCQMVGQPYISWIIDFPNFDLFRGSIKNSCNIIFVSDSWWSERLKELGAGLVFYLPPAAMYINTYEKKYCYDATFIGEIKQEQKGTIWADERQELTLLGYLDALIHSQRVYYGKDIITNAIPGYLLEKLEKQYPLNTPADVILSKKELYTWMQIVPQLEREQRRIDLARFDKEDDLKFIAFTGQEIEDELVSYEVRNCPQSQEDYLEIINATICNVECMSRELINGVSRHAFNVLGQGGALLANECIDLKEMLQVGEDYLEYHDCQDLYEKAQTLKEDETYRKRLQKNAREKVLEAHTYLHRIDELLQKI